MKKLIFLFSVILLASCATKKPYTNFDYSYARSDKKDAPRISIGGRLVADLLATAGATFYIHSSARAE